MARITKKRRELVWKLFYEGLTTREISDAVGLSEYQVVSILGKK